MLDFVHNSLDVNEYLVKANWGSGAAKSQRRTVRR